MYLKNNGVMAFTIEEIESVFTESENGGYISVLSELKKTAQYLTVTDYLTGKSKSLQGITFDYSLIGYSVLLDLIQDIEHPSSRDQLLIDLIIHPDVSSVLKHAIPVWLSNYVAEHPGDSCFQAVLHLFRQTGHKDDEIFISLIGCLNYKNKEYLHKPENASVRTFILGHMRQTNTVGYFPIRSRWTDNLNELYFSLLEEVNEPMAQHYVIDAILNHPETILFFNTYRNGYYFSSIVKEIENENIEGYPGQRVKLNAALYLYSIDETRFTSLLITLSRTYLDSLIQQGTRYAHEGWVYIKELNIESKGSYQLSTCAVFYLLKYDKDYITTQLESWFSKKQFLPRRVLEVLFQQLQETSLPLLQLALLDEAPPEGTEYFKTLSALLQKHFNPADYIPSMWKLISTKSKPLKTLLVNVLIEKDPEVELKAIDLLDSKNSEVRQTGALILQHFSTPAAVAAVNRVLQRETNDNARDILLSVLASSLQDQHGIAFTQEVIEGAKRRRKLTKPQEPWLEETRLAPLYYKNGEILSADDVRFLLYRMSRVKGMRSDIEARLLLNHVDKKRAADFAKQLLLLFIDNGMKSEQKYLLALSALLGNEELVDKIRAITNNWIEENRTKMAEYGVGALALQGSDKALRWVEWYSRKYRNKKAVIGITALQALEDAAEELDITAQELGDRIVPDFGFEGLFKHFKIGHDEYRAFIDSNFKMAFFDEDNKRLKSIPASAPVELKEEFKAITKEVRDVVKGQSLRLEHYLVTQRGWPFEQWQLFFLNNPVMFIYATKLLWGVYINSELVNCFICQEDTTLINQEEEEISIPDNATICIVHPLHLPAETLQVWRRKFFDLSIGAIFPQLERPVFRLDAEHTPKTIVQEYAGKVTENGSIKSVLDKYGWQKGAAGDGGSIGSFHYKDFERKMEAVLEVEGVSASGFQSDYNPTLGRLYFIAVNKQDKWFREPKDEKDERLLPLSKVPGVFYSEVISGIKAIKLEQPSEEIPAS